jgi:hypothetical protein
MKKSIFLLTTALCLCALVAKAQTITDTRLYGSWVHARGEGSYSHFKPGLTVPPAKQNKMQSILQVFIDAYPKPYKESVCYGVKGITKGTGNKSIAYNIHMGDYGFTYDEAGKIKSINPGSQLGDMYEGYGNVYVNYIPEELRITTLLGNYAPVEKLSYYQKKLGESEFTIKPKGKVIMVGPQNNFEKEIKEWKHPNPPPVKFNNEADSYFSIRILKGNKDAFDKNKMQYVVSNLVILSANNQLPYNAISRKEFLDLLEENLNEEAEVEKNRYEKYFSKNSDKAAEEKMFNESNKERKRKYDVINLIRNVFNNELDKPAIIGAEQVGLTNAGFYHIFNRKTVPTAKEVSDVFITEKLKGYALYRYDANFYKGLKEDDIKTIAIEWADICSVPLHEKFPDANAKNKDGVLFTDTNYHAAMRYTFNWGKLASLLTK